MAHSRSARKRVRQNETRRLRNRHHRSSLRTAIRRLREAVAAGDAAAANERLPQTIALIDRMAGRGVLHKNAAARTKSRLSTSSAGPPDPARRAGATPESLPFLSRPAP